MTARHSPHWKQDVEERIRGYLGETLDALNPDGSSSGPNIWRRDRLLRILAHHVDIPGVSEPYDRVDLIHQAVGQLKGATVPGPVLVEGFREALTTLTASRLATPAQAFRVVFRLHVPSESVAPNEMIDVLGQEFRCVRWADLRDDPVLRSWWEDLDEESDHPDPPSALPWRFVPLLLTVRTRNPRLAWAEGAQAFDLLRALLNLRTTWGVIFWQSGRPRPLGKVLPPPRYAVFSEDGRMTSYYTVTKYDYGSGPRPVAGFREARENLTRIERIPHGEIRILVVEVLRKYGEALDTVDWRQAFLSLWQALEVLTMQAGDERSGGPIRHRIAALLGQRRVDADLLAALAKTRHALVHAGQYPDDYGLEELNLLRVLVERSVDALLGWADLLEDRPSVDELYNHLTVADSTLRRRARVIEGIRRRREGR